MSTDLLLALDLGTTRVTALLVEAGGGVRGRADAALEARFPGPGRVEQDPEAMWVASLSVLRGALANAGASAGQVAGLGVVAQRSTALAWDASSGAVLAPAIGWQDQRTEARCTELRAIGIPINTLPSATKFEWWLRETSGEAGEAIRDAARRGSLCLGTPDVWLTHRLTGGSAFVTDPGHASCTGLYDLESEAWNPLALKFFAVPAEALPQVVGTSEVVGETPASMLGAAIPVAARAGDQQAATFAQGAHAPGEAKLTLGTSAMLDLHTGATPPVMSGGTYPLALWRLPKESAFCLEGTVITAGAAIDWLVEVGLLPSAAQLDSLASAAASAGGAYFVPALQGLGTPTLDGDARGRLGGLSRATGRAEIARAAVEGIANRCVDVAEALGIESDSLRVDGGLARSESLMQALADLSGLEVRRAAELETTALGAAMLAGLSTGVLPDLAACRATITPPQCYAPAMTTAKRESARTRWNEIIRADAKRDRND